VRRLRPPARARRARGRSGEATWASNSLASGSCSSLLSALSIPILNLPLSSLTLTGALAWKSLQFRSVTPVSALVQQFKRCLCVTRIVFGAALEEGVGGTGGQGRRNHLPDYLEVARQAAICKP
jgi:hypothetical protein